MQDSRIVAYNSTKIGLILGNLPRPQSLNYKTTFFTLHPQEPILSTLTKNLSKNIEMVKVKIWDQFKDEFRTFEAEILVKVVNSFK